MRVGQVLGGLSVMGLVALIALSLTASDEPASVSTATSVFIWDSASTTSAGVGTVPTTSPAASPPQATPSTARSRSTSVATTSTASTAPAPAPTTGSTTPSVSSSDAISAPLPESEWPAVDVKVLNGGPEEGAATFVTGVLTISGFRPREPSDAAAPVDETTVLFAPGREREARAVNDVVGAPNDLMAEGTDQPNWTAFGDDLDVLVVLGPPDVGDSEQD